VLRVLDFYPGDRVMAGAGLVVVAICITSVVSLLIAKLVERRPPLRHTVLAAALLSILATPPLAIAIRNSGKSTFKWNLLPAPQSDDREPADTSAASPIGKPLALILANNDEPNLADPQFKSANADALNNSNVPRRATFLKPIDVATVTTAVPKSQRIRVGLTLAMIAWLVGSGVLLARLAYGSVRLFNIWRSCKSFSDNPPGVVKEVLRCLGAERLPAVLLSDKIQTPSATGALRGAVILPTAVVKRITTDELCDVLVHECAHVVRRDPLMRALQGAAELLFWPIPWVHWLNQQLNCACEDICDNYVIAHRDAVHYAETLLRVATLAGEIRRSFGFVGVLRWRGKLESRIARLIDKNACRATRAGRSYKSLCLVAFLTASVAVCGTQILAARKIESVQALSDSTDPASGPTADPAAPIEVEVWWGVGGLLNQAFQQQVDRFNELQNEIVVDVRLFDGYGELHRELNKALQGDDLPDAAVIEIHQVASFAAAGQIQALDKFVADDRGFRADDLLPGILTNLRYHEMLYALPMNRSTPILYYNKDRFSAAGLDPAAPPATWQALREISRALTHEDQKQYGFLAASSPWVFESLVWSNGGELIVDGKPTFAKSGAAPLRLWADMVHRDHTAKFVTSGDRREEFMSGRAAMAVDSTALLHEYTSQSNFALGTAPLPRSEGGKNAVPTGGGAAVIPAANSADRKAAAWRFLTWFINTRQAAHWSRTTGYIPVRESARSLLSAQGFYDEHPTFAVAIEQMKYAREAPQPQWAAVWKIIGEKMTSIVCDDAPALTALEGAEQAVAKALNSKAAPAPLGQIGSVGPKSEER
jgi:sn-glycerol 3-phosphate transport system substrate-binding protein